MKIFIYIILLVLSDMLPGSSLIEKKIPAARIKMVDGEYAKLADFHSEGPMIINFWTTW